MPIWQSLEESFNNKIFQHQIAVAEKYRPIYEKQAKENQRLASGGDRKSDEYKREYQGVKKSSQDDNKQRNPTVRKILSDVAGVSENTYAKGVKILNSNNEELKNHVLSGKTSISAGYKKLQNLK